MVMVQSSDIITGSIFCVLNSPGKLWSVCSESYLGSAFVYIVYSIMFNKTLLW